MGVTSFLLLSCLGLAITAQAQDCSRPAGKPNMGLSDKDILLGTFPHGTRVSFTCDVGYMSAGGSAVITCTAGRWSLVKLKCQKKNCGSAGEVANRHIDYSRGTLFGDKIVISCNSGYRLVGNSEITCGAHGWMGRLPECEVVNCDPPPTVADGTFSPNKETFEYREVVQYTCQKDLTLVGSNSLTCSDDGTFQPGPPTCVMVECAAPVIENAEWTGGSRAPHRYKDTVTYQCRSGYNMTGEGTLTCGINSQWSPGLPTCKRRNCGSAGEVANGHIDYSRGTELGDKIVISCNSGYRLVGNSEITCGVQGWMDRLPECEVVTCDPPPTVADGTFSPNKETFPYREVVQYTCQKDLTLVGSNSLTCSDDGTFQPGPPTCVMIECAAPVIENAEWAGGSRAPHRYKDTVTYQCRSGYNMTGEGTLTCGINSQWSPGLPTCKRRNCGSAGEVANGYIDYSRGTELGDKIVISCNSGYRLVGNSEITCGAHRWMDRLPECEVVTCDLPPTVADGTFSPNSKSFEYGDTVQYTCQKGYALVGSNSATCSDDGTFRPRPPTCVMVECADPVIENAEWTGGSRAPHRYKDTVTYQCRSGYTMMGVRTVTCEINGQWSPGLPTCQPPPGPTSPLGNNENNSSWWFVIVTGVSTGFVIVCIAIIVNHTWRCTKKRKRPSPLDPTLLGVKMIDGGEEHP